MRWTLWEKDHRCTDVATAAACDQGVPSRLVFAWPWAHTFAGAWTNFAFEHDGPIGNYLLVKPLNIFDHLLGGATQQFHTHESRHATARQSSCQHGPPESSHHRPHDGYGHNKASQEETAVAAIIYQHFPSWSWKSETSSQSSRAVTAQASQPQHQEEAQEYCGILVVFGVHTCH